MSNADASGTRLDDFRSDMDYAQFGNRAGRRTIAVQHSLQ
jgi:hypothetical protein